MTKELTLRCKFTQISSVEQNDSEQPIRPLFGTPSMKLWLLIALNFGCYGVLILFARFDLFSWLVATPETSTPMVAKLSNGFFSFFTFLIPCLIFANAALPDKFDYYKLHRKVNVGPVVLGVFAILASVFFIDILAQWNAGLITDPALIAEGAQADVYQSWVLQMPTGLDLLVSLAMNALVPAVVEELFFRGGVMQLLGQTLKKPHVAIILSALFFSMLHLDLFAFFPRFVLGIALGYLFWWSGSLRLSIAAHFAFNAFSIVNTYLVQHYPESWWAKAETTYVLGAVSLAVSVGALLTCRNLLKRRPSGV